jgi:hypothetical protein
MSQEYNFSTPLDEYPTEYWVYKCIDLREASFWLELRGLDITPEFHLVASQEKKCC